MFPGHRLRRMAVLDCGTFDVGPGKRQIGIPAFLLETDLGARLLVDTGFDAAYATDPAGTAARDGLGDFGRLVDFTARQTVAGQLNLLGLSPADIDFLILTHGHIDHVGGLSLFAHCPILLTAVERAALRPIYWGDVRPVAWPQTTYHEITADTEVLPGLTVLPTPGHTPGHLSLHLALPSGREVILAADAINRESEPAEGYGDAMDPTTAASSGARLLALQAARSALLIYGHDPVQWTSLPKAPECLE